MKAVKNIRLPHYNYSSDGCYFVTITSHLRKPILLDKQPVLEETLQSIISDGAILDFHVIMPDHVHMIIVLQDSKLKLGEIVRRFKARSSKASGGRLWQPNYYEHVIRSEKALDKIREYIMNNPHELNIELNSIYENINSKAPDKSGSYIRKS